MSDQSNKGPLEKFFQDHLDQFEGTLEEGFWNKLEPKIPPPPRRRVRVPLWWLFWTGSLLLIGLYFWTKEKDFKALAEQVVNNKEQIEILNSTPAAENTNPHNLANTQAVNKLTIEDTNVDDTESSSEGFSIGLQEQNTSANFQSNYQQQQSTTDLEQAGEGRGNFQLNQPVVHSVHDANFDDPGTGINQNLIDQNPVTTSAKYPQDKGGASWKDYPAGTTLSLIPFLKSKPPKLVEVNAIPQLKTWSLDATRDTEENQRNWSIGAFYAPWWNGRLNKTREDVLLDLSEESFLPSGYSLGLTLEIPFGKKWSFQTGLGWSKIHLESEGSVRLNYNKEGAIEVPTNYLYNNYVLELKRAIGNSNFYADIGHQLDDDPQKNPIQDSTFYIRLGVQDHLQYLHLPIHVQYWIGQKRLKVGLGLGVDIYQLIKMNTAFSKSLDTQAVEVFDDLDVVISNYRITQERQTSPNYAQGNYYTVKLSQRPNGLRRTFLESRIALAFDYQLYRQWYLRLDGAYHLGLTPIKYLPDPANSITKDQTYLNYWRSQIGVRYQF